ANSFGPGFHGLIDGSLHGAAEARPLFQLFRDVLGNELGVHFRPVDLDRLDLDVAVGQVFQVLGELVYLLPFFADDHADAGRVDEHHHFFAGPLDLDLGNARTAVTLLDELAKPAILDQELGEILFVGIPRAEPRHHDA